jgi:hypothetical protein
MTDPIVQAVKIKLDARSASGIEKYGTTLFDNKQANTDPTYWLRMAQEEALDLANYLECEIQRIANVSKGNKAL